ncbi:anhydro-N-acetylmuramic acid kinase [Pseudopelagicola sp. nBUS_19]|uniref:anhydro-N-acetylmuramic acid kinase n=1 Tax=Pseudopelagicola sp. nBUS_19 TaxID=3395316 RepID=UPI003EBDC800
MLKAGRAGKVFQVLGAMSGTSLDGVDAAVIKTDGVELHEFGPSKFRAYSTAEQAKIKRALGQWSGLEAELAAHTVNDAHIKLLTNFDDIDLVGFHGQTLAHEPRGRGTFQVGDGQALAEALRVPVVWDFRSADVALGGEGAPLAPFFHFACAKWIGAKAPLAFLNLGGVGNLTWIDPSKAAPEDCGALLAFDTGPANAPLNDFVLQRLGIAFDDGGRVAAQGVVAAGALELFLNEAYFNRIPPKSMDRNEFTEMTKLVCELSDADAAATLTAMCAASVVQGMGYCPVPPEKVLATGGGRNNPVLMQMLSVSLDCPIAPVEAVGLDGDMLEAQAFAYLAARVALGMPTSSPSTTGVSALVGGGTVSEPNRS